MGSSRPWSAEGTGLSVRVSSPAAQSSRSGRLDVVQESASKHPSFNHLVAWRRPLAWKKIRIRLKTLETMRATLDLDMRLEEVIGKYSAFLSSQQQPALETSARECRRGLSSRRWETHIESLRRLTEQTIASLEASLEKTNRELQLERESRYPVSRT